MADLCDQAQDLEERDRAAALERHRRRQPYRDTLPPGFDVNQPGDERMAEAMADEGGLE